MCGRSRQAAAALFFLLAIAVAAANAQAQDQKRHFSREELISAARGIMTSARYCALITEDRRGRASARTMDAFAPDADMVVWLATNPRSRKAGEIRRNPRVTLYYFDREHQAYVTLYGTAELVSDAQEKARHWKEEWKAFYPDRQQSYLLIKITPTRLEIVDTSKGIVSQTPTWQPPTIYFARPKR